MKRISAKKGKKLATATKRSRLHNYFEEHFGYNLKESAAAKLESDPNSNIKAKELKYAFGDHTTLVYDRGLDLPIKDNISLTYEDAGLQERLLMNLKDNGDASDPMAAEIFGVIGRYMDLCCISQDICYMDTYCNHVISHVMQSLDNVFANNVLLQEAKDNVTDELIESTRDRGFHKMKVLIITPFKKYAHAIVHKIMEKSGRKQKFVGKYQQFEEEYGDTGNVINEKWRASTKFRELMSGNIEDAFRIGIGFDHKMMNLYTEMDSADIIIASPLGMHVNLEDDEDETLKKEEDMDFLSSVELLIIDNADVLYMQNWENILKTMEKVNTVPNKISTSITRVRPWCLNNYGRFYRQTMIFSRFMFTELYAFHQHHCRNFAGTVTVMKFPDPSLPQISIPLVQELHRFECENAEKQSDVRLEYFRKAILPKLRQGTIIFISSYFDYVRIRNLLKYENESFCQIQEYASDSKIKKVRKAFKNREKNLLLLTERCHYFRHFMPRGVKSIVFYQMPVNPEFYADIISLGREEMKLHCRLIYSKHDLFRLQNVFGPEQVNQIFQSDKKFHVLMSE